MKEMKYSINFFIKNQLKSKDEDKRVITFIDNFKSIRGEWKPNPLKPWLPWI